MQRFVIAINSVGSQPWAIVVLLIGCGMYLASKRLGLDYTIPATIVGVGANMLQAQVSKTISSQPHGSEEFTTTSQVTETPQATFHQPESK